jgi:hypothetical protein
MKPLLNLPLLCQDWDIWTAVIRYLGLGPFFSGAWLTDRVMGREIIFDSRTEVLKDAVYSIDCSPVVGALRKSGKHGFVIAAFVTDDSY